jgi:hypothetical protein
MTDAVLARLTYEPAPEPLTPIPWPAGLAPTVISPNVLVVRPRCTDSGQVPSTKSTAIGPPSDLPSPVGPSSPIRLTQT